MDLLADVLVIGGLVAAVSLGVLYVFLADRMVANR
jgi:hypothetical protein